jgi:hypothetical protein
MNSKLIRNMKDPESRDFWIRLDARAGRYEALPDWIKEAAIRKPRKPHASTSEVELATQPSAE